MAVDGDGAAMTATRARFALIETPTGPELQTDTFVMDASDEDLMRSLRLMALYGDVRYVPGLDPSLPEVNAGEWPPSAPSASFRGGLTIRDGQPVAFNGYAERVSPRTFGDVLVFLAEGAVVVVVAWLAVTGLLVVAS